MVAAVVVKVAVSAAPYSIDKPYDYLVPDSLRQAAFPGVRVIVPFGRGNRETDGIILSRSEEAGESRWELKPVRRLLDQEPVLDQQEIALALWMRQRYFCTLYEAVRTILPTGLWYQMREVWRMAKDSEPRWRELAESIPGCEAILEVLLDHGGSADLKTLKDLCGPQVGKPLAALQKEGVVFSQSNAKRNVSDKKRRMVSLALPTEEVMTLMEPRRLRSPQRYEAVHMVATMGKVLASDLIYFTGVSKQALGALVEDGILAFSDEEELRVPVHIKEENPPPIVLNEEQQQAFEEILALTSSGKGEAVLLHGVTGSGKTSVYLRLVQAVLAQGRSAMVLVPEIVLTPQIMRRFSSYFGDQVAMIHSGLRVSERYDQWKRIRRGEVKVVLGTRSAIFAPLKQIGLIIMDEEQEGSYQSESPPRYHTRDIAKYLCAREKCVLLLGSATPSVETYWAAEQGIYKKALLRHRYNEGALPRVIISDLRQKVRFGNSGMIGPDLRRELEYNLRRGEQSILFLNRRGNSRMLLCGECGYVPECLNCSVPLTYHSANDRLMCHYCGFSQKAEPLCRKCSGFMKRIGAGTQQVEEELNGLFPGAAVLRMDADTAAGGHEQLLQKFEKEKIPILLGTQMVAKGLDFENVTLVGVLAAELSLFVDNYRAAERTFNLLTQVVGRAGRGEKMGRAVIQTYTPRNDVILCAADQDYERFYEGEVRMRRLMEYPPFRDLFTITVSSLSEDRTLRSVVAARDKLRQLMKDVPDTKIYGPATAPVVRMNNRYRYRILLVGKNNKDIRDRLSWLLKDFANDGANRGINIFIDCNPLE